MEYMALEMAENKWVTGVSPHPYKLRARALTSGPILEPAPIKLIFGGVQD